MEFKKLRKGFLKKGIKVLSFTLTLSVLMLSIFAFRSDKEAEAATFSASGNTLTCDGETYTKGVPAESKYGVNAYVFTNSSTTENIIWIDGTLAPGTKDNDFRKFLKDDVFDVPGGSKKIYFDVDLNELKDFGYIFEDLDDVTDICFGENFRSTNVTDMNGLFLECSGLNTIEFGDHFDTSNVETMNRMFSNCPNLASIDLSGFDCSKVKEAQSMFFGSAFTNLDLSMLDFSNCQNFYLMFSESKITTLDLSNWNIKNATSIDGMFNYCSDLQSIKMGKWKLTPGVFDEYEHGVFENCTSLKYVDVSGVDVSDMTFLDDFFSGCESLKKLDLSTWDTSKCKNFEYMFYTDSLEKLDISNFVISDDANIDDMFDTPSSFKYITVPKSVDSSNRPSLGSSYKFVKANGSTLVTIQSENCSSNLYGRSDSSDLVYMTSSTYSFPLYEDEYGNEYTEADLDYYNDDYNLSTPDVSAKWNISDTHAEDLWAYAFKRKGADGNYLTDNDILVFKGTYTNNEVYGNLIGIPWQWSLTDKITKAAITKGCNLSSYARFFDNMSSLTEIDFECNPGEKKWTTNLAFAFSGAGVKTLDFSMFDKSKSKITEIWMAFSNTLELTSITGLENFDLSETSCISSTFDWIPKLTSVDVIDWDVSNIEDFCCSFECLYGMEELDFSGWNVSKGTNFAGMFEECAKLRSLNLSGWTFGTGTINFDDFVSDCPKLETIIPPDSVSGQTIDLDKEFYYYNKAADGKLTLLTINGEYKSNYLLGTNDAAGKTVVPNLEFNYLSTSGPIAVYDGIGYYEDDYVMCDDDDDPSTPEVIAKFDISLDKTEDVWAHVFNEKGSDGEYNGYYLLVFTGTGEHSLEFEVAYDVNPFYPDYKFYNGEYCNHEFTKKGWRQNKVTPWTWLVDKTKIKDAVITPECKFENYNYLFLALRNLEKVDLQGYSGNVSNMDMMFGDCDKLTTVNFGTNWNTSNVENFGGMFKGCTSLVNLDLSSFDFTNVTNLAAMFLLCKNLENICIMNLNNASNLSAAALMFADCEKLKHIYTSKTEYDARSENCNSLNFDLTNLQNFTTVFAWCKSLEKLDFNGCINASELQYYPYMFYGCENLKELDLSKLNFSWDDSTNFTDRVVRYVLPDCILLMYEPSLIEEFYAPEGFVTYWNASLEFAYEEYKLLSEQMYISDTPISFYDTVFYGCNKLEKVVLPQSVLTDSDKQYNLPVELNMFENLTSTEKLKLNESDKTTKLLGANINAKDASGADKPVTVLKKVQTGGGGSGSGGGGSSGGGGGGGGAATPVTPEDEVITLDKYVMHDAFINGYEDKTFKPNNKMTRAEFAKIMACISEDFKLEDYKDASSIIKSFGDIRDNYWYTPYIAFVIDKKIMNGYPEGDFKPEGLITRAEVSKVLGDIYNVPDKGIENTFLSELREDWFKDQADELIRGGIIKGYDDGTFGPKRNITRAEFVALLNRVNGFTPDIEIPKEIKDEFDKKFSDVREKDWFYLDVLEASISHKGADLHKAIFDEEEKLLNEKIEAAKKNKKK